VTACGRSGGRARDIDGTHGRPTHFVDDIARRLGADPRTRCRSKSTPQAAEQLLNPSSVARAVAGGATEIERVDKLVQLIGRDLGVSSPEIDETVAVIDASLAENASRPATENVSG
jgi:hypothetical protein